MSSTARPASRKASGVARPTSPALPCGLMLAAMLGAIRATEIPTACQTDRLGRRPLSRTGAGEEVMGAAFRSSVLGGGACPRRLRRHRVERLSSCPAPTAPCGHVVLGGACRRARGGGVDVEERGERGAAAERLVPDLAAQGVVAVATTFVDNAGIARVKSVPVARLP